MNPSGSRRPPGPPSRGPPQVAYAQPKYLRAASSSSSLVSGRNSERTPGNASITEKYELPMDPDSYSGLLEPDDKLHNPDPSRDKTHDRGTIFTSRGLMNLGCVFILIAGIVALFVGFPVVTYLSKPKMSNAGGFNIGGINSTGQIPDISGNWGLIDKDTPEEFRTKTDYETGASWQLVFSDEFNTDGRSFYPGDDPYWEAVDLHYWATGNLEWYDPKAITTRNGSLEITLSAEENHNLNYTGGMLQSWNKFCFTGGLVEASVMLPGFNNVRGLWPAVWAMGNLGRAGYGATLDGLWPYTYDACDVGTLKNQTLNNLPVAATTGNDPSNKGRLSFLPGQRLSRCTCPGESHPGPVHSSTGEYVGRAAPEIDMLEAQIGGVPGQGEVGAVSQSGQWGPFNYKYTWLNTSDNLIIQDETLSSLNTYIGGVYQQATSVITVTDQQAYEFSGAQYTTYGFQYSPGFGDAYISWIANGQLAWTLRQPGMGPDTVVEISDRPVPQEPMYLLMNLGISTAFGAIDFTDLQFPSTMRVDWIRVYQDPNNINIGCDPTDFPTAAYINEYAEAYNNANLTTWVDDFKQTIPKNKFAGEC